MARIPDERLKLLGDRKKLSPKELKLMQWIWEHPDGISSEDIYAHFQQQARSTISTVLTCISQKGYVENRQIGLHHFYTALVTRTEYEQALLRQQVQELFGSNSLNRLVAAFYGKENLTDRQQEHVQALLEELEKDAEAGGSVD